MRHLVMEAFVVSVIRPVRVMLMCAVTACGAAAIAGPNSGPPFTYGTISGVDSARRYRVDGDPSSSSPPVVFFRTSRETGIERSDGSQGTVADLQVGRVVAVWASNVVPGSNPPEIVASGVLLYQR